MTESSQGRPFDPKKPNVARMYDHLLGGKDNLTVDREQAEKAVKADPSLPMMVQENRGFVRRATRFLAGECGIDQFLDIGSGLPTQENVHEIAQGINAEARVVYVDYDPVVKVHAHAMLAHNDKTEVLEHDVRNVDGLLREVSTLLDFERPVGVISTATLHFVPDEDDPHGLAARIRDAIAVGSYLALTHASADERPEQVARVVEIYKQTSAPGTPRTRDQFRAFFGDFELVEPGVVWVPAWRADKPIDPDRAADAWFYAGVGRKVT